ncbi:MAG: DUF72 domain-containing protein [Bauldia sp.]
MIRVGIGGWTFAPWRNNFYPAKHPHAQELAYASRHVTTIEINGTFYRTQSAASFGKWRDETPNDFVFAVKGHRGVVNQRNLADAAEAVAWFLDSGVLELKGKLGPLLWQMPPHKRFDRAEVEAFFALLPRDRGGLRLTHAFEPRHETFVDPAFIDIARRAGVAIVYADSKKYPSIADQTGEVVYARLQNAAADEPTGYPPAELDAWRGRAVQWAKGEPADGLPHVGTAARGAERPVFIFMINGAKERAPAAAMALIERLRR